MRTALLRLALLLAALLPLRADGKSAVDAPHVRVELLAREPLSPGRDVELGLRFVLEKGWHVYWSNPGDSGEAPAVRWTLPAGAETAIRIDALKWPTPHRLLVGPLANYGYPGEVLLPATLHAGAELARLGRAGLPLVADVTWLVCEETCIPGKAQLGLELPIQAAAAPATAPSPTLVAQFAASERALPQPVPAGWRLSGTLSSSEFLFRVELAGDVKVARAELLPLDSNQIENAAEQQVQLSGSTLSLRVPRSDQLLRDLTRFRGVLVLDPDQPSRRSYAVDFPITPAAAATATLPTGAPPPVVAPSLRTNASASSTPFGLVLVFALLGGVLLNLMPCVFPVLSVKAIGLVQMSAADRRVARGHALFYLLGILVSLWGLAGALIALRYTGQQIGWGFHLQSPRFLLVLSGLLFFLGLNLLGVFELGLGLTQLGQVTVGRHGYTGAFATGVLATVVATPCTAPFMGTAVGFALSQSAPAALLIFSFLGLGLALPYVLLPWVPGLLRALPRPGAWMETFKQAMGFLLFGTVLWLAWVLGAQAGADGVVALLAGLFLVGVAGWVLHRWGERRGVPILAAVLVLGGLVLPGWQLGAQSGGGSTRPQRASAAADADDLPWVPFSPQKLAEYRRAGTPVFIDFTADWCVSCKVNERLALRSPAVRARIAELGIVAMKADWTNRDAVIAKTLQEYGRSGVPFYVLYGRDPNAGAIELPAVLSTGIVLRALDGVK